MASARYTDPGLAQRLGSLDPVVTADGDRLRFESFSSCNGVHARLDLLPDALQGEIGHGTTNVDVNPPLRTALAAVTRDGLVHLAVGEDELAPWLPTAPTGSCGGAGATSTASPGEDGARCTCPWQVEHDAGGGPCKHLLATLVQPLSPP